jgi:WD40 repeat protein
MKLILTFLLALILTDCVAQKLELRIPIAHTGYVQAVALSPDEKYIATGASDKSVKIWSTANGMQVKTLSLKEDVDNQVQFLADNRHLTVRMEDGWEYWDMLEGKMEYEFLKGLAKGGYKIGVAISTDGTLCAIINPKNIMIRNATDGKLLQTVYWNAPEPDASLNLENIKFNSKYFAISQNGKLRVFNIETGKAIDFTQPDTEVGAIALAPDKNELYVNGKAKFYKVNLDTGAITVIDEKGESVNKLSFSNNGKYLLKAPRRVVDRVTNKELHYFFDVDFDDRVAAGEKYFVSFNRATSVGIAKHDDECENQAAYCYYRG